MPNSTQQTQDQADASGRKSATLDEHISAQVDKLSAELTHDTTTPSAQSVTAESAQHTPAASPTSSASSSNLSTDLDQSMFGTPPSVSDNDVREVLGSASSAPNISTKPSSIASPQSGHPLPSEPIPADTPDSDPVEPSETSIETEEQIDNLLAEVSKELSDAAVIADNTAARVAQAGLNEPPSAAAFSEQSPSAAVENAEPASSASVTEASVSLPTTPEPVLNTGASSESASPQSDSAATPIEALDSHLAANATEVLAQSQPDASTPVPLDADSSTPQDATFAPVESASYSSANPAARTSAESQSSFSASPPSSPPTPTAAPHTSHPTKKSTQPTSTPSATSHHPQAHTVPTKLTLEQRLTPILYKILAPIVRITENLTKRTRQTIGYIALITIFNTIVLWSFVLTRDPSGSTQPTTHPLPFIKPGEKAPPNSVYSDAMSEGGNSKPKAHSETAHSESKSSESHAKSETAQKKEAHGSDAGKSKKKSDKHSKNATDNKSEKSGSAGHANAGGH